MSGDSKDFLQAHDRLLMVDETVTRLESGVEAYVRAVLQTQQDVRHTLEQMQRVLAQCPPEQAPKGRSGHTSENRVNPSFSVAATAGAPRPVDNSPGQIAAALLDRLSKRLGYPILRRVDDPLLARWVEADIRVEALENAVLAAIAARRRDGNRAPLNPGYIDAFLTAEAPPPQARWWGSWSGIEAQGATLGLTQAEGEAAPAFKQRVFAASGRGRELADIGG